MGENDYLRITIGEDGFVNGVEVKNSGSADFVDLPASLSLSEAPLDLGSKVITDFRTITLVRIQDANGNFTWLVKHPTVDPIDIMRRRPRPTPPNRRSHCVADADFLPPWPEGDE